MKKRLYIISALFLLLASSCTNELEIIKNEGQLTFSSINASMADLPTSRTHLENGGRVVWDVNDQVGIFSDTQTDPIQFACTSVDDSKASFVSSDEVSGSNFFAFYPYENTVLNENSINFTLPEYTGYTANSYLYHSPMIAKSNTNEFKFKQTCGIVKFAIKGSQIIEWLTLTGNNNEIISGTGCVNLNDETPQFTISANAVDASINNHIVFSQKLQLSSEPTDFYFIVPPIDFSKGLNLTIQYVDENGSSQTIKKSTSKSITVSRSVIKSFNAIDLNELIEKELEEEKLKEERIYTALMAFYNATGGENWKNNTNWGSDKPYSEWFGLIADNYIYDIYLDDNNLQGYIPEEIGYLTDLRNMVLSCNKLSGSIPESIGNLKELTYLNLLENKISGSIPESICNLEKLHTLRLDNNCLSGELPANIGNMKSLESFDIGNYSVGPGGGDVNINDSLRYYNQISGEIPLSLTTLTNLKSFGAIENNLSGNIPDEIWGMPSLTSLTLDGNKLTGGISPAIANAKQLTQLWLSNNHLTGTIPEEIGELTNLKELWLGNSNWGPIGEYSSYQYNVFEGSIPSNIASLTNLETLDLATCGLSGDIPTSIYTMNNLYSFSVGNAGGNWDWDNEELGDEIFQKYNHISGDISSAVSGMTNLRSFAAGGNEISGSIPKEFSHLQNLESLFLYGNKMSGTIPEEILSCPMWSTSGWNPEVYILPQQDGYGFTFNYYESTDYSKDGEVKVLQSAIEGAGIDIILMGDGYSDRLIADGTYEQVMHTAMEKFFSVEPYKSYRNNFNVYSVNVVSPNEGYSPGKQTALSCYLGAGTLAGGDDLKVFSYVQKAIGEDQMNEALIVVMMNSTNYAGTCYMYYPADNSDYGNGVSISYFPVGEDETALEQVLHHEAGGHGFAKLGDEYAYDYMGEVPTDYVTQIEEQQSNFGWWKNVDFTNEPANVRWSKFLLDTRYANDGLGLYEGGLTYWTGVWRSSENSIMRYNTGGFNAPSREAIYYRIHKLAYGEDWEYDYEKFVEYDAVNLNSTVSRSIGFKQMPPLHKPVIVNSSWKNAKSNIPMVSRSESNSYKESLWNNTSKNKPKFTVNKTFKDKSGKVSSIVEYK